MSSRLNSAVAPPPVATGSLLILPDSRPLGPSLPTRPARWPGRGVIDPGRLRQPGPISERAKPRRRSWLGNFESAILIVFRLPPPAGGGNHSTKLLGRCQLNKLAATILFPRDFIMRNRHGFVLAEADGVEAGRVDAEPDQFLAQSQGAPFAEGAIVFLGAAFVAVAADLDGDRGVALQLPGHGLDIGQLAGFKNRTVVFEMDGVGVEEFVVLLPTGVAAASV